MWSRGVQGDAGKERLTLFSLSSSIMPLKAAPKRKPARNKAVKSNKTTEKNAATKRKAKEEANRRAKEKANRKAKEEANRKAKEKAKRKAKEEAKRKAKEEAKRKAKKSIKVYDYRNGQGNKLLPKSLLYGAEKKVVQTNGGKPFRVYSIPEKGDYGGLHGGVAHVNRKTNKLRVVYH